MTHAAWKQRTPERVLDMSLITVDSAPSGPSLIGGKDNSLRQQLLEQHVRWIVAHITIAMELAAVVSDTRTFPRPLSLLPPPQQGSLLKTCGSRKNCENAKTNEKTNKQQTNCSR